MPTYKITKPYFTGDEFGEHVERMTTMEQNPNVTGMTAALQQLSHIYGGKVPTETIVARRRRNRAARAARRGDTAALARITRQNKARNTFGRYGYAHLPVSSFLRGAH